MLLELEGAGPLGIAAGAGSRELTSDIGESVFETMETTGQRLGGLLGRLALLLGLLETGSTSLEQFFLPTKHLEQGNKLGIRLFDLVFLLTNAEMRGVDISTGAEAHLPELSAAFSVRFDAALTGEDPVPQCLQAVTGPACLGIKRCDLLARSCDLQLLLPDLTLVKGAGISALFHLLGHLGNGTLEVDIGAVRKMRVEDTEVLHERLIATRLPCLTLQGADLALHLLDDVGDTKKIGLGVL